MPREDALLVYHSGRSTATSTVARSAAVASFFVVEAARLARTAQTSCPTTPRDMKARVLMGILLAAMAGCARAGLPAELPKEVFLPSDAREVRVSNGAAPGQIDVAYVADEKYPARQIRQGLARALRESGYQLLDHDFLDPNEKLEIPREWGSYVTDTGRRETCVREVVEDWQNAQGDVVRCSVRYDSPCDAGPVRSTEPTTTTLRVTVGMIPAAAARAAREVMRESGAERQ